MFENERKVYELLEDDESKRIFLEKIKHSITLKRHEIKTDDLTENYSKRVKRDFELTLKLYYMLYRKIQIHNGCTCPGTAVCCAYFSFHTLRRSYYSRLKMNLLIKNKRI